MVLEEPPGVTPLAVLHTHVCPCRPTPAGVAFFVVAKEFGARSFFATQPFRIFCDMLPISMNYIFTRSVCHKVSVRFQKRIQLLAHHQIDFV
jgi:hypothetical protein